MLITTQIILLIAILLLLYMIASEQPIWLGLLISGSLGILLLQGADAVMAALADLPYQATGNYAYVIIPMFILMGVLCEKANVARDFYSLAAVTLGKIPGGLGIATIFACGGFAAVTGSSVATAVAMGRIAIGEMRKHYYRGEAAGAIVAAGGTLGVLIPPSIILVVYGIITGESIGRLLLAGVIPGIITIACYSLVIAVCYVTGYYRVPSVPKSPQLVVDEGNLSPVQMGKNIATFTRQNIPGVVLLCLMFAIIIGGLYGGWFTATECGAIAASVAVAGLMLINRSNLRGGLVKVVEALQETSNLTSMVFALMIGGVVFSYMLVVSDAPQYLIGLVAENNINTVALLVIIAIVYIVLGCFLDSMSILLTTAPLVYPIMTAAGVDGILLGIIIVKLIEIGMITPPVGLNVFVAAKTVEELEATDIFKKVWPFVIADLAVIAILFRWPSLTLFLTH